MTARADPGEPTVADTIPAALAEDGDGDGEHSVITALRRRYDELTHSQKRIAETIVDDPRFVAFATVDKFAARLGVSPSTIVRFAYRIGLSGYPELQEHVRELVLKGLRPDGASSGDAAAHLGNTVFAESLRHDMEVLERTAERLRVESLDRAVDLIANAARVRVVGGVTAYGIAYYAAITLERVRDEVLLLTGASVPTGPLLDMRPGDVVLAFSFPPYAKATLGAIDAARSRGASIVAITDSPVSPLRGKVDVVLPATVSGIGVQNSLVAAMAVANAVVNGVTERVPGALERYSRILRHLSDSDVYLLAPGGEE
jgi:DNA-binding MurR/RpiR family transcriptional regulator